MNKSDLTTVVAEKTGLSKTQAAQAVDAVIAGVAETLKKGDKVALGSFFTAEVKKRDARQGRNPRTGEQVTFPAKNVVAIKAGKTLRDAVAA